MNYGAHHLRNGYTFDPESLRETWRLATAYELLKTMGVEPVRTHSDAVRPDIWNHFVSRHECDYRCTTTWPEWVTDELLDQAYRLADMKHTAYGESNRRAAQRNREELTAAYRVQLRDEGPFESRYETRR